MKNDNFKPPWQRALEVDIPRKFDRQLPGGTAIGQFVQRLLRWYSANGREFSWRRSKIGVYEVVITEALLQRTRAETVQAFLPIFLSRYSCWKELARENLSILEVNLKPIGLQKRRAKTLQQLSQAVIKNGSRVPGNPSDLLKLPGIGQYLFYAINLYRRNDALPLLDASMARLIERNFGDRILVDIRYDPFLQQLSRMIIKHGSHKSVNWAMLDIAAAICKPRSPNCAACPLRNDCTFFNASC